MPCEIRAFCLSRSQRSNDSLTNVGACGEPAGDTSPWGHRRSGRCPRPLTDIACRSARCPGGKSYVHLVDGEGPYLEVTASGGKLWRWKYRFAGKEKRLALVRYPDVALAGRGERDRLAGVERVIKGAR